MKTLCRLLGLLTLLVASRLPAATFVVPVTSGSGGGQATNAIGSAHGLGTNTSFYGSVTNNGTLRQVGNMEARGEMLSTNGNIKFGGNGFYLVLGEINDAWFFTNNYITILNGQQTLGNGAAFSVSSGTKLNVESGGNLDLDHLPTNSILWIGPGGIVSTQKLGANLSMSADGTLSASGGSGSPAGSTADMQFNEGGVFAGTNRNVYIRSDNQLKLVGVAAFATNGTRAKIILTNDSNTAMEFNASGLSSPSSVPIYFSFGQNWQGHGSNVFVITPEAIRPAVANSLDLGSSAFPFKDGFFANSVITPLLQVGAVSNATFNAISGGSGVVRVYGTNTSWFVNLNTNCLLEFNSLKPNTPYIIEFYRTNNSVLTWSNLATLNFVSGFTDLPGTNISRFKIVLNSSVGAGSGTTNVSVEATAQLTLGSGPNVALITNGTTITATLTNRSVGTATNAFTLAVDFSDAANTQIYNVGPFSTNALTIATTNLVDGRTVCVYMATNMVTYDVTVLDMAGAPILWNFNVTTNGATAFKKTNTIAAKLYLSKETNGVVTADFGYYRN